MSTVAKHMLVLGLGESGIAMARLGARAGWRLRAADSRDRPPGTQELSRVAPGAELVCGPFSFSLLDSVDVVALSPGLSLQEPVVQEALRRGLEVVGEIELFARRLGAAPVIAITGTNGKTTVTSLVGALARAAGRRVQVAGNISPAALTAMLDCEEAGQAPDLWVLELSSFQLETTLSLKPVAATVLNISDDHLDRYDGLEGYAAAKARIFAGAATVQVLNRSDARVMQMAQSGHQQITFGLDAPLSSDDFGVLVQGDQRWLARGADRLMNRADLPLAGDHNVANALAGLALGAAAGLEMAAMIEGLKNFSGLPHRVEKIATCKGVDFYDDSKGTNVGATVAALNGLGRKVALIAGGDGKGQDFSALADPVSRFARVVALMGRDARAIESAMAGVGVPLIHAADMHEAVAICWAHVQPGDAVLLSPACASLDMYRNYEHRAQVFAAAVNETIAREEAA